MPQTIVQGNTTWSVFEPSAGENLLARDITKKIYNTPEFMKLAPFFMLLEAIGRGNKISKTVKSVEYEMVKDDFPEVKTTMNSDVTLNTSSAVNVSCAEKGIFKSGDTVYNVDLNEHARVASDVSGTGSGNVSMILLSGTGVWLADHELITLDNTMTEGGTDPTFITTQKSIVTNYVEHFVKGVGITHIANNVETLTEDRLNYERKKMLIEYYMAWERKFFFGKKLATTSGGQRVWHTGGILDSSVGIATANRHDLSGALLTKDYFEKDFLLPIFQEGGNDRKILFCSPSAAIRLNDMYQGSQTVNLTPGMKKKVGISTSVIYTQLGELEVAVHYFFKPGRFGTKYQNVILLIDPEYIEKVGLQGMGSVDLFKDRQANNVWSQNEVYSSVQGLRITSQEAHGLLNNFAIS